MSTVRKSIFIGMTLLWLTAACGAQVRPTEKVADIVNATLTAIAQNNPHGITSQTANIPSSFEAQPTAIQSESLPSENAAQNNLQDPTSQIASPSDSMDVQPVAIQSQSLPSDSLAQTGNMTYFWPGNLPAGFVLSREISYAGPDGFALTFMNPSIGAIRLVGGAEADQYQYCANLENNPSEPVMVRGLEGCFPPSTGGGFAVEWNENGTHYAVGGMGLSKESTLAIAEQLEAIDLATFLARLAP